MFSEISFLTISVLFFLFMQLIHNLQFNAVKMIVMLHFRHCSFSAIRAGREPEIPCLNMCLCYLEKVMWQEKL